MTRNTSLAPILDKSAEHLSFRDLAAASPGVFAGMSDQRADLLGKALGVKTVRDLARHRIVRWAQAVSRLAAYEKASGPRANPGLAPIFDTTVEHKSLSEIARLSPTVFAGFSREEAGYLMKALDIETIDQLAGNRFVVWAQAIDTLAEYDGVQYERRAA